MKNIVIFGAPGSGKGTQSDKLIEKYGLEHISIARCRRHQIGVTSPYGGMAAQSWIP